MAVRASAAAVMVADVLGFVAGLAEPGFRGKGGGARSGSELSHLCFPKNDVSFIELTVRKNYPSSLRDVFEDAYIGTDARPESEKDG